VLDGADGFRGRSSARVRPVVARGLHGPIGRTGILLTGSQSDHPGGRADARRRLVQDALVALRAPGDGLGQAARHPRCDEPVAIVGFSIAADRALTDRYAGDAEVTTEGPAERRGAPRILERRDHDIHDAMLGPLPGIGEAPRPR
jgi:hypothetical protein